MILYGYKLHGERFPVELLTTSSATEKFLTSGSLLGLKVGWYGPVLCTTTIHCQEEGTTAACQNALSKTNVTIAFPIRKHICGALFSSLGRAGASCAMAIVLAAAATGLNPARCPLLRVIPPFTTITINKKMEKPSPKE